MLASATALPAWAADGPPPADDASDDILVTAQRQKQTIENAPNATASVDADTIARTTNAMNVEDTVKYLPSLIVRKRHIGDTQAPLATRTSGLGASARSLIYADGALLSALIGNNNTSASPRWSLVSPQEIARIDVLYGPFSAAYPGNSIGAVVNITTRLPDKLEATRDRRHQRPDLRPVRHAATRCRPIRSARRSATGSARSRCSPAYDHVDSRGQPLGYVTATVPARPAPPARRHRRASTTSTAPASRSACSARAGSSIRCRTASSSRRRSTSPTGCA